MTRSLARRRTIAALVATCAIAGALAAYLSAGGHSSRARHAAAPARRADAAYVRARSADALPEDFLDRATAVLKLKPETIENVGNFTDSAGRIHSIYFAQSTDGNSCLLENVTGGAPSAGTAAGPTVGGCRPANVVGQPLRRSAQYAGSPDANRGVEIVGLAKPSVDHVRVFGADGRSYSATLNSRHVFFFESAPGRTFGAGSIAAYGRDGTQLLRASLRG